MQDSATLAIEFWDALNRRSLRSIGILVQKGDRALGVVSIITGELQCQRKKLLLVGIQARPLTK